MKAEDALKGIKFALRKSENKYEGRDTNVLYLSLSTEYKDQDYLVLSATCAERFLQEQDQKAFLGQCDITYDEHAGWGLQCPQTTEVLLQASF